MKIKALYISQLVNAKHFNFMQFVVAACSQFSIVTTLFPKQVLVLREAFENENEIFLKHNRNFLTPTVQENETNRDKGFRALRDALKVVMLSTDAEKVAKAKFIMGIIDDYGGARITNLAVDAESGVLTNLCEDLLEKYPTEVAAIGLTSLVEILDSANKAYIQSSADRTLDMSQKDKAAMLSARGETDTAYHGFVDSVNLHVQYDGAGELVPFIKYLNTEIDRYRVQLGISVGGPSAGSGEEEDAYRYATFEFANGIKQSFPFAVGAPIIVPENTPGFIWKPAVPEFMPKTNRTFKEVPIEVEMGTAIFHFADHREEEIREAVGAILHALDNTEGYVWDPEVPEFMPAGETSYYEVLATPAEEMVTITFRYHDGREVVKQYPKGTILSQTTLEVPEHSPGYTWGNYHMPLNYDMTINEYNPNEL